MVLELYLNCIKCISFLPKGALWNWVIVKQQSRISPDLFLGRRATYVICVCDLGNLSSYKFKVLVWEPQQWPASTGSQTSEILVTSLLWFWLAVCYLPMSTASSSEFKPVI